MSAQRGLRRALEVNGLAALADALCDLARRVDENEPHGDQATWRRIIDDLPRIAASSCDFTGAAVRIGERSDCGDAERAHLKRLLLQLQPWRKGPFDVFGVRINSEWRSDMKWARLAQHIGDLRGRRVLDVGCGNGYYLWRMLGGGAKLALGIDPGRLFVAQFAALKHYCPARPAFVLPLRSGQFPIPAGGAGFDSVFSMGVLYHRRNPRQHLRRLLAFARPGGEVVVESLVVDGGADEVLVPAGRYAKMRNVHAIASAPALQTWLRQAGARDIRLCDLSATTVDEQRATEWMRFESLADFLDPADPRKTIEGHPAPKRAIFLCRAPD